MGLSFWQILLIVLAIVLLFSARKLPGIARSIGQSFKEFRNSMSSDKDSDENEDNPVSDPTGAKKAMLDRDDKDYFRKRREMIAQIEDDDTLSDEQKRILIKELKKSS